MWLRLTGLLMTLTLLTGCAGRDFVTSDFCLNYEPVCLSRQDTKQTQDAVLLNEAKYEAICPVDAAKVKCQ